MTGRHWIQSRIAESRLTLPTCLCICTLVWWYVGPNTDVATILSWLLCMGTVAVLMETNIGLQILRVRTRLTESLWLLLIAATPGIHFQWEPLTCALCLASSQGLLLCCYQKKNSPSLVFHSFLFLGIGSIFAPAMWIVAILFYVCLATLMRAFSWKGLWAGLIGLFAPYWCWLLWEMCLGDIYHMIEYLAWKWTEAIPEGINLPSADKQYLPIWGLLLFLNIIGIVHYMSKRYEDKIRIRMFLYVFVFLSCLLQTAFVLFPYQRQDLLPMLSVSVVPLVAYYWALTWGKTARFLLILSFTLWIAVLAFCLNHS